MHFGVIKKKKQKFHTKLPLLHSSSVIFFSITIGLSPAQKSKLEMFCQEQNGRLSAEISNMWIDTYIPTYSYMV
jgi:hypothetical protein